MGPARIAVWTLLTLFLMLQSSAALAEIIPQNRRITWTAGVPGGIPNRTTIFANVKNAPYNAKGDGVTDDTAAIRSAINACPSNQVVYIPAGNYKITSSIQIDHSITVRGAGMDSTILTTSGASSEFFYIKNNGNDWYFGTSTAYPLTGGLSKGSTNITVGANPTEWSVGDIVLVDQLNDNVDVTPAGYSGSTCSYCSRASGTRNLGQFVEVKSVSPTNFTFDPPLYVDYNTALTPQGIECKSMVRWIGFESLQITNANPAYGSVKQLINFEGAAYWWVKDCRLSKSDKYLIKSHNGFRGEVRSSIFGWAYGPGTLGYGPDQGYGMLYSFVNTACLFEDNILHDLHVAIATQGPSGGHVIAYNFITNTWDVDLTVTQPDVVFHSAHGHMNLVEGNNLLKINADNMNGSSGYNTVFRNRIRNKQGAENYLINAFELMAHQYNYNVVGNVLGTRNFEIYYETEGVDRSEFMTPSIYRFGYYSAADESAAGNDSRVKSSILRHGNWDSITAKTSSGVVWDASISDHTIPNSLYLMAKPAWWGTLPWPAVGPDLTPIEGQIPAQARWNAMQSGGGNAKPAAPSGLRVAGP